MALAAGGAASLGHWGGQARAGAKDRGGAHAQSGRGRWGESAPASGKGLGRAPEGQGQIAGMGAGSDCKEQYWKGAGPALSGGQLPQDAKELCFRGFALLHSQSAFTALVASEHLTRERVLGAERLRRKDAFHEEGRLPPQARARRSEYAGTGMDKGHFAPSEDMPDEQSQFESFSMANMFLEDPRNNRVIHAAVERAVRRMAKQSGEAYAATGVSFGGGAGQARRAGRVRFPDFVWKAVYLPGIRQAGAYWEKNASSGSVEIISLEELRRRSGVDPFPGLPEEVKSVAGAGLPAPRLKGNS